MSQSTDYPRYLGDFYYGGTLILQCIKQPVTIHNWVTFCGTEGSSAKFPTWICSSYGPFCKISSICLSFPILRVLFYIFMTIDKRYWSWNFTFFGQNRGIYKKGREEKRRCSEMLMRLLSWDESCSLLQSLHQFTHLILMMI